MIRRVLAALLALGAVVAAIAMGAALSPAPLPSPSPAVVDVTPARQDVACPGPLVTPSGVTGADPELGGAATGVSTATFLGGQARKTGAGSASDAVVGSTVERVTGGDITGLAALTCTAPRTDQWIVAGSTAVGSSARLVLTNPAQAAVEVVVTAFGEIGELEQRTVAIGPDAQAEVLLEGLVVDVSALAVHIESTGTGVAAALQDSRLNGFQPFGTDWATASAVGTDLAIPGVGTNGSDAQVATVRLIAPQGATATLGLSTPEGMVPWAGVAALKLEPGVAIDVLVPAVPTGTVTISADAPVAASAIMTRTRTATSGVAGDIAQELRWVPAVPAADAEERAAVTVGYDETVVVYAQRRGTLTLTDDSGATIGSVALAAGATGTIALNVPPGTTVTGSGPYAWVITVSSGDLIAAMAPTRTTIDPVAIQVRQRPYVPSP